MPRFRIKLRGIQMKVISIIGLILLFVTCSFAADSPLVAAAKKEKERRAKLAKTKVLTNEDVDEFKVKNGLSGEEKDSASSDSYQGPTDPWGNPLPERPVHHFISDYSHLPSGTTQSGNTQNGEGYWRQRKQGLESEIAGVEQQISTLRGRISIRQHSMDPGYGWARHDNIVNEILQMEEELTRLEDQLKDLRQQLEDLPEDARRAGALPGWIRD